MKRILGTINENGVKNGVNNVYPMSRTMSFRVSQKLDSEF